MRQQNPSLEFSGSLTPELEGAQRTIAHPKRYNQKGSTPEHGKGGKKV